MICGATLRSFGSKTQTSFSWLTETNARSGVPAKTQSPGSSPVSIVATTFPDVRSTTLTESLIEFTTHASVFERARTDTGSRPTGIVVTGTAEPEEMSKTSSRASARFTASSVLPSGVMSIGCTGGVSQLVQPFWALTGPTETPVSREMARSAMANHRAIIVASFPRSWTQREMMSAGVISSPSSGSDEGRPDDSGPSRREKSPSSPRKGPKSVQEASSRSAPKRRKCGPSARRCPRDGRDPHRRPPPSPTR